MTNPDLPEELPTSANPPQPIPRPAPEAPHLHDYPGRGRRKAIAATCELHRGPIGFANLVVSKREGTIVLNPHADGCCVISLDQDSATKLCETLTEWLG